MWSKFWSASAKCGGRCWYWCPLKQTGSGAGAGRAKWSSPGMITAGGCGTLKRRGGIWGGIGWWGCWCRWGLSIVRFDCSSCWAVVRARCGVFRGVSAFFKKQLKKRKKEKETTYINPVITYKAEKKQPICSSYAIKPKQKVAKLVRIGVVENGESKGRQ